MIDHGSARIVFSGVMVALLAFLIGPSVLMLAGSLSNGAMLSFPPHGLSLRWYAAIFQDDVLGHAFLNTLWVSVVCATTGILAGTLAAIALARCGRSIRGPLELYLLLPFAIPLAVEGVGLLNLTGLFGLVGVRWAIGIAIAATNLPFVIGAVSAATRRLDPYLDDAAASCGAAPLERLLTVTVPALMPGILVGGLVMFVSATNEFVISSFLVDVNSMTLPVELFNQAKGVTSPLIAAISVLYTAASIAIVFAIDRMTGLQVFLRSS